MIWEDYFFHLNSLNTLKICLNSQFHISIRFVHFHYFLFVNELLFVLDLFHYIWNHILISILNWTCVDLGFEESNWTIYIPTLKWSKRAKWKAVVFGCNFWSDGNESRKYETWVLRRKFPINLLMRIICETFFM